MKLKYNYVLLNEGFHNWLETNYLPIPSQNLFFKLIHLFNLSGWSEWLAVDNQRMMSLIQTKREQSVIEWRDKLLENNLIVYIKCKKGTPNKYKLNDKLTFINEAKSVVNSVVQNVVQSEVNSVVEGGVQSVAIYKQNKKNISLTTFEIYEKSGTKDAKKQKHKCGEYKNVLLTDTEYDELKELCGEDRQGVIDHLSSYIEMKGYKVKSHYLAIRKWVITAYKEQKMRKEKINSMSGGIGYGRDSRYPQKKLCTEYPE